MAKLPVFSRSVQRKPNESMRLVVVTIVGVVFGFFIGISFPTVSITKLHFPSSIVSYIEDKNSGLTAQAILNHAWTSARNARGNNSSEPSSNTTMKIYVPTNPRGAEMLPPGIVSAESDLDPRRLYGDPAEQLAYDMAYLDLSHSDKLPDTCLLAVPPVSKQRSNEDSAPLVSKQWPNDDSAPLVSN